MSIALLGLCGCLIPLIAGCVDSAHKTQFDEYPDRLFTVPGITDVEYVKSRLREGVDPNLRNNVVYNRDYLLTFAAHHGALETVKVLLDAGADIDIEAPLDERTPLFEAAYRNHIEVARYLIERGADVNALDVSGNNPLYMAIRSGNPAMVKLLLEAGTDPDQKSSSGRTMREIARIIGAPEIKQLLGVADEPAQSEGTTEQQPPQESGALSERDDT